MKGWLWIPFVFVLGLLVGTLGPRLRLQRERDELERLRKAVSSEQRSGNLGNVVDFLRIGDGDGKAGNGGTNRVARPSRWNPTGATSDTARAQGPVTNSTATGFGSSTGGPPVSLKERIDEAAELWRIRSDIARSSFVQAAALDPRTTAKFDVLVEAMNIRLRDKIDHWADYIATNDVTPETGVRVVKDLTEVMVVTYDEMDRSMPGNWREKAGPEFDLGGFIDPAVATPLLKVEPKFREQGGFRRNRRTQVSPFDDSH